MPLPADITAAITEADESKAASETVIVGLVGVAQEVNMTGLERFKHDTDNNELRITVSLRSLGVSDAIADDLETLFALTRGTQ